MIGVVARLAGSREFWIALGVVAAIAYFIHWGDTHGFNARKVASIEAELAAANARVHGYTLRDDQAAVDADVLREAGYHRALAELDRIEKCPVTPAMAAALTRIAR